MCVCVCVTQKEQRCWSVSSPEPSFIISTFTNPSAASASPPMAGKRFIPCHIWQRKAANPHVLGAGTSKYLPLLLEKVTVMT